MTQPFYVHQHTDDFDAFCENVRNWDLDYQQLESGRFTSELLNFGNNKTQFTHARLTRRMIQRGTCPKGLITFGILADPSIQIHWRNTDITNDMLFVFPDNGELNSITQSDFDVYAISLSEDTINQACARLELPEIKKLTANSEVFDCDTRKMSELRQWLKLTDAMLTSIEASARQDGFLEQIEQSFIERLLNILSDYYQPVRQKKTRKRDKARIIAEQYIFETDYDIVTLSELCRVSNTSERTLEYAFKERYGLSPKGFATMHRLNRAHKALRLATPETNKVSDIARQLGFWHMGSFSTNYKRVFDALPSTTLKQVKNKT